MNMKKLCGIIFTLFFSFAAFAQDFDIISEELFSQLKKDGSVQRSFIKSENIEFLNCPNTELANKAKEIWTLKDNPVFFCENIYLVEKETLLNNSKNPETADVSIDGVSKVIRSVSKMKGMEYFSNSDKKTETLYHEANLIKSKDDKTFMEDKLDGSADGLNVFCILDDNTFGEAVYYLEYAQRENEVSVCFTNVGDLKLGPIKGVKPGNMKIYLCVTDFGDYYLVYLVTEAKYISLSFLENALNRSFNARIDAIYKWFLYQF